MGELKWLGMLDDIFFRLAEGFALFAWLHGSVLCV